VKFRSSAVTRRDPASAVAAPTLLAHADEVSGHQMRANPSVAI